MSSGSPSGLMRCHAYPPSLDAKTPLKVPATTRIGSEGDRFKARTDSPSSEIVKVRPASALTATPPPRPCTSQKPTRTSPLGLTTISSRFWSRFMNPGNKRCQLSPPLSDRYRLPPVPPRYTRFGAFGSRASERTSPPSGPDFIQRTSELSAMSEAESAPEERANDESANTDRTSPRAAVIGRKPRLFARKYERRTPLGSPPRLRIGYESGTTYF